MGVSTSISSRRLSGCGKWGVQRQRGPKEEFCEAKAETVLVSPNSGLQRPLRLESLVDGLASLVWNSVFSKKFSSGLPSSLDVKGIIPGF